MKRNSLIPKRTTNAVLALVSLFLAANSVLAQTDQSIYADSLQNNWQDWGWATINYDNTSPVHSGSKSVAVTVAGPWQAIYIAHPAFDSGPYANLTFWLDGGTSGGQRLLIQGHAGGAGQVSINLPTLAANTWQQFSIPLASLGVANRTDVDGFWIQDRLGAVQPTFYLDDIALTVIPEPSIFALAGLGAAALMIFGRCRYRPIGAQATYCSGTE
jgi:alpha-L-arabinofuranosidase